MGRSGMPSLGLHDHGLRSAEFIPLERGIAPTRQQYLAPFLQAMALRNKFRAPENKRHRLASRVRKGVAASAGFRNQGRGLGFGIGRLEIALLGDFHDVPVLERENGPSLQHPNGIDPNHVGLSRLNPNNPGSRCIRVPGEASRFCDQFIQITGGLDHGIPLLLYLADNCYFQKRLLCSVQHSDSQPYPG